MKSTLTNTTPNAVPDTATETVAKDTAICLGTKYNLIQLTNKKEGEERVTQHLGEIFLSGIGSSTNKTSMTPFITDLLGPLGAPIVCHLGIPE